MSDFLFFFVPKQEMMIMFGFAGYIFVISFWNWLECDELNDKVWVSGFSFFLGFGIPSFVQIIVIGMENGTMKFIWNVTVEWLRDVEKVMEIGSLPST